MLYRYTLSLLADRIARDLFAVADFVDQVSALYADAVYATSPDRAYLLDVADRVDRCRAQAADNLPIVQSIAGHVALSFVP